MGKVYPLEHKNNGETPRGSFPVSLSVVSHTRQVRQELKLLAHSSSPLKWTEILVDVWSKEVMPRRLSKNYQLVLFQVFHE
ncbi:hypothetical protein [Microcoleus sp. FACHB-SPT15]|uniref:hypothetical protein n=1 Tax=Microcoleus sp. FACHB-SPT15 TaxID=2692830 RepID=UPI00177EE18B|nr:hypothetical protein [Microcoleus sp. FACHB-SPT15]